VCVCVCVCAYVRACVFTSVCVCACIRVCVYGICKCFCVLCVLCVVFWYIVRAGETHTYTHTHIHTSLDPVDADLCAQPRTRTLHHDKVSCSHVLCVCGVLFACKRHTHVCKTPTHTRKRAHTYGLHPVNARSREEKERLSLELRQHQDIQEHKSIKITRLVKTIVIIIASEPRQLI